MPPTVHSLKSNEFGRVGFPITGCERIVGDSYKATERLATSVSEVAHGLISVTWNMSGEAAVLPRPWSRFGAVAPKARFASLSDS